MVGFRSEVPDNKEALDKSILDFPARVPALREALNESALP
jgi:hypothetical protein